MIQSEKQPLYVAEIPVRWGDMDTNQHVNNTRYYQYLEEARIAWLDGLGAQRRQVGQGLVLLKCTHYFLKPVDHPAVVIVELYPGEVGRSSLTLDHRMYVKGRSEPVGHGDVKMVWIDVGTQKPVPVPDSVRVAMGYEPLTTV
ncbi:MAG TPA: acyl-CoA thioesterase [Pseudomonas xinjiangensis]|uniref:Acyl-CoA thioesterase n=2 Tax=root TaxID=1 RepID=A0A7V1BQM6_9GAMM|nr:acyl-CoA thioesterase [Halopseudomonas xinjiangensis]HEC48792.1 acyl-CoA thioesterase [Halopseudomonas xinjiangensis]